jgi:hypothetical protein
MYSNGVSVGTTTTIPFENSNCKLTLAATAMFFAVSDYQGHIDDFRITKGVARYTSAFTPPSRSLPDYTTPLPAGPNTDNYWFPTSTLLKGDGTDNGTSFTDSTGKHTWTATNAVTKTGVKKFGTASMYFSGTNSYLAGDGSSDFAFGTTDFTIEMWIYRTATGVRQGLFDTRPASTDGAYVCFEVSATDKLNLYVGSSSPITATTTLAANTWYHVAICRASNNTRLFVNGVQDGATYSDSNTYGCGASRPAIGVHAYAMNAFLYTGYIDNLRVTKGFARYTANFAPPWYEFSTTQTPTSSYDDYWNNVTALIHSDTRADGLVVDHKTGAPWVKNGGVTLSNTQSKYGGYSCYFDGNGDYLTGDGSNNYDFPGDFTIEMWAYRTVAGVQQVLYDSRPTSSNGVYIYLDINSDKFRFHTDSGGTVVNTTTTLSANTWYHLSISRTGTTTRLFVNGISEGSLTSDSRSYLVGANRPSIGIDGNNGTVPFSGYIDELRITKGVGRYTTNFVPHTQAHYDLGFTEPNYNTNWDDVILLLQGSYLEVTTNLRDSSKKLVGLTNTSNYVVASTTQKKWGTHSLYLSGAVDHALKYTGLDALGSSSFTLEFWIYPALTGGGTSHNDARSRQWRC